MLTLIQAVYSLMLMVKNYYLESNINSVGSNTNTSTCRAYGGVRCYINIISSIKYRNIKRPLITVPLRLYITFKIKMRQTGI